MRSSGQGAGHAAVSTHTINTCTASNVLYALRVPVPRHSTRFPCPRQYMYFEVVPLVHVCGFCEEFKYHEATDGFMQLLHVLSKFCASFCSHFAGLSNSDPAAFIAFVSVAVLYAQGAVMAIDIIWNCNLDSLQFKCAPEYKFRR